MSALSRVHVQELVQQVAGVYNTLWIEPFVRQSFNEKEDASIRAGNFCYAIATFSAAATTEVAVQVISYVARKVLSEQQLSIFGQNPSSLAWGNLRCSIGLIGILGAVLGQAICENNNIDDPTSSRKVFITTTICSPIGLHYIISYLSQKYFGR